MRSVWKLNGQKYVQKLSPFLAFWHKRQLFLFRCERIKEDTRRDDQGQIHKMLTESTGILPTGKDQGRKTNPNSLQKASLCLIYSQKETLKQAQVMMGVSGRGAQSENVPPPSVRARVGPGCRRLDQRDDDDSKRTSWRAGVLKYETTNNQDGSQMNMKMKNMSKMKSQECYTVDAEWLSAQIKADRSASSCFGGV